MLPGTSTQHEFISGVEAGRYTVTPADSDHIVVTCRTQDPHGAEGRTAELPPRTTPEASVLDKVRAWGRVRERERGRERAREREVFEWHLTSLAGHHAPISCLSSDTY